MLLVLVGLLAPALHEFSHAAEIWRLSNAGPGACAEHPAGVHVESGFTHLRHAPCIAASRVFVAVVQTVAGPIAERTATSLFTPGVFRPDPVAAASAQPRAPPIAA